MRRALRIVGAVCAAVSVALLGGCALSLQTLPKITGNSNETYPVRAIFANVLNLPDDAQVRVGAQVVGQVGDPALGDVEVDPALFSVSADRNSADIDVHRRHWHRLSATTNALAAELTENLRLILEPTQASKLE